jgi:hypothetical protein
MYDMVWYGVDFTERSQSPANGKGALRACFQPIIICKQRVVNNNAASATITTSRIQIFPNLTLLVQTLAFEVALPAITKSHSHT